MSFNRSNSTGNCNPGGQSNMNYEPFMLGSSQYGVNVGSSSSASGIGNRSNQRGSVRDCMQWGESGGNAARVGGKSGGGCWNPNQGSYGEMGGNYGSMNGQGQTTTSMGFNYVQAPPKAFVTSGANGQGEGGPRSQIPIKFAPPGTNPQSLLEPMAPVTVRVTAPIPTTNADGGHNPHTFTIDPSQIYGKPEQTKRVFR